MTTVTVNGRTCELGDSAVDAAVRALGVDPGQTGIAVALNGTVVPRGRWSLTRLRDGDHVEVLTAAQGG